MIDYPKNKQNFCDHFFFFSLASLTILVGIISYYRFTIQRDYVVEYEGSCNPDTESCYIGCNDDECIDQYYYSKVVKYALDLYKQCGDNITDCYEANVCLPTDSGCSIVYCNPEDNIDDCAAFNSFDSLSTNTDILLKVDNI